jgi:hypothetical protein
MIYQTFQEPTRARGARKIKIVNIGLEPWEAIDMDLEIENVSYDKRMAVADYVREREDGAYWEEWLQTHRIELNAMTTPEFIAWLDRKMADHGAGKLVSPEAVIVTELEKRLEAKTRTSVMERILREAGFEDQVTETLDAIKRPTASSLVKGIRTMFKREPEREWRDHVETVAAKKVR